MTKEAKAAVAVADEIAQTVDDLPDRAKLKAADYFESVAERAEAIADTIRSRGRVTDAQAAALDNMLEGVRKWVH